MVNTLYYGDNLHYLRELPSESVDLVYLDPPFNSQATYNLLFRTPDGAPPEAQTTAFKDTWSWNPLTDDALDDILASGNAAAPLVKAFHAFLGHSDMMAYLCMMAVRLIELRRVLRPTGSLYLHCDPTSCHYLKILLDGIFGATHFINDISWKRTTTKSDYRQGAKNWPRIHDTLLHYARDSKRLAVFSQPFAAYSPQYVASKYRSVDPHGRRYMLDNLTAPGAGSRGHPRYEFLGVTRYWRYNETRMRELFEEGRIIQPSPGAVPRYKRYLDEVKGIAIGDFWDDIPAINSQAQERTGYPTQKPLSLLSRIIDASSQPGDIVLDPFCGCGTTIEASEKLQRQWIGIDITTRAIEVIEGRLNRLKRDGQYVNEYKVHGRPDDLESAIRLAEDKYEFQWWATWLLGVQNYRERKKGADAGVDGVIYFKNGPMGIGQIIISVKGGDNLNPDMVRALGGVVGADDAQLGIFVCLAEPTPGMRQAAVSAGRVRTAHGSFPRLQIATIKDLLDGRRPEMPPPIETQAFRSLLRPTRAKAQPQPRDQQLSLPLMPIAGGRSRRKERDVQNHLSGEVLAQLG